MEACGASFEEIIASRNSCKKYKNEGVSDVVICQILSETIVRICTIDYIDCSNG